MQMQSKWMFCQEYQEHGKNMLWIQENLIYLIVFSHVHETSDIYSL